jgi:hypothetical protein
MSVGPQTRVGRLKIRVDRVIYTTIMLMAVLIVYDGWEQLRFGASLPSYWGRFWPSF